jgi:hypothetical protein
VAPISTFIGREEEVARLGQLLAERRLVNALSSSMLSVVEKLYKDTKGPLMSSSNLVCASCRPADSCFGSVPHSGRHDEI